MGMARWLSWSAWEVDKLRKQQAQQFTAEQNHQTAAYHAGHRQGFSDGWRAGYEAARAELAQESNRP